MIRVSVNGLTIAGTTEEDFELALSKVAQVAALAAQVGAMSPIVSRSMPNASKAPRVAMPTLDPSKKVIVEDGDDATEVYESVFGRRFRIAKCEEERFASEGDKERIRQFAARQRLEWGSEQALTDEQAEILRNGGALTDSESGVSYTPGEVDGAEVPSDW